MPDVYRTAEFAKLAGVTSRALRHYDRLGLLRPGRSGAGYRIYRTADLERLERIVALRALGVPLKRIASMGLDDSVAFVDALRVQRHALEAKRRHLAAAAQAISEAEATIRAGGVIDPTVFKTIIATLDTQRDYETWLKAFTDLVRQRLPRLFSMSEDERHELRNRFVELFREIQTALDEAPSSPRAQALADRWDRLMHELTGLDLAAVADVGLWVRRRADHIGPRMFAAWGLTEPDQERSRALWEPYVDKRVFAFLERVRAIRQSGLSPGTASW